MASILIWGRTRDVLAGDLPPGISAREVGSLAELQAHLDGKGGTLVLAEPEKLEGERAALEAWLKAGGSLQAMFVAVSESDAADEVLKRFPFLDDLIFKPVTPGRMRLRLDRALDAIHNRRVIAQLDQALARKSEELHELNKIGVALSAERDIDKLLELILVKCREITAADAGSLYLVERGKDATTQTDDKLRFKLAQNDSVAGAVRRIHDAAGGDLDRGLRGALRPGRERGGRVPPAARLALQVPALVGREVRLPHEVDAGRADARPQGRGDRRRPAHQQEARRQDRAATRGAG